MTAKRRGDDMAEKSWDEEKKAKGLNPTAKATEPASVKAEEKDKLFSKEEEKDGVVTVISSVDEETANVAKVKLDTLPKFTNLTLSVHGVPGDVNLTADGTLNNDRSERLDKTVEEMNEIIAKTAGPNPMPNREGNELTKIENGFRADIIAAQGNSLRGYAKQLKDIREKGKLDDEDKKKLEDMEKGLVGTTA